MLPETCDNSYHDSFASCKISQMFAQSGNSTPTYHLRWNWVVTAFHCQKVYGTIYMKHVKERSFTKRLAVGGWQLLSDSWEINLKGTEYRYWQTFMLIAYNEVQYYSLIVYLLWGTWERKRDIRLGTSCQCCASGLICPCAMTHETLIPIWVVRI